MSLLLVRSKYKGMWTSTHVGYRYIAIENEWQKAGFYKFTIAIPKQLSKRSCKLL